MLWEKHRVLWGYVISHPRLAGSQRGGDTWTHNWRIGRVPGWGKGTWKDPDFREKHGTLEVLRDQGSWNVRGRERLVSHEAREASLNSILQDHACHGKNLVFILRTTGKSINSSKPGNNMTWFPFLRKSLWLESEKWIRAGQQRLQPLERWWWLGGQPFNHKLGMWWRAEYYPTLFKITGCGEADLKTVDDTMWWASHEKCVKHITWRQQMRQLILSWRIRGSCTRR